MSQALPSPGVRDSVLKSALQPWQSAILVLGLVTIFRLWAMSSTDLVPDEAYYWLWSRSPSIGYYDHPPMIAWWIWLSTSLFGSTSFGVRVLPVLSVAVTSLAVYQTSMELYDDSELAKRATIWLNATLLVAIGVIFATPDAPSVMFWALTVWALARLRRTGNPALWLVIGLLAGAGCVGKYTNFFIGPGIVLWLVIDPRAARWRFSPWLLIGGLVAFATFLPVLYWNAAHDWISFRKQFGRIGDHHFDVSSVAEFMAGQLGLLNPIIAIFAAIACGRFTRRSGRNADPFMFLAALTAPVLIYLVFHSFHDRVHANWPAPAYPALAIAAALGARNLSGGLHLRRAARLAAPVGIGLSSLLLLYFATPLAPRFPWASPADTVIGWKELVAQLEEERRNAGAAWLATTDYGLTGEIAFYSQDTADVQEIIERQRYSFEMPDPSLAEKPALLAVRATGGKPEKVLECFQTSGPTSTIARRAGDRVIENYLVVSVSGARKGLLADGCQPQG